MNKELTIIKKTTLSLLKALQRTIKEQQTQLDSADIKDHRRSINDLIKIANLAIKIFQLEKPDQISKQTNESSLALSISDQQILERFINKQKIG